MRRPCYLERQGYLHKGHEKPQDIDAAVRKFAELHGGRVKDAAKEDEAEHQRHKAQPVSPRQPADRTPTAATPGHSAEPTVARNGLTPAAYTAEPTTLTASASVGPTPPEHSPANPAGPVNPNASELQVNLGNPDLPPAVNPFTIPPEATAAMTAPLPNSKQVVPPRSAHPVSPTATDPFTAAASLANTVANDAINYKGQSGASAHSSANSAPHSTNVAIHTTPAPHPQPTNEPHQSAVAWLHGEVVGTLNGIKNVFTAEHGGQEASTNKPSKDMDDVMAGMNGRVSPGSGTFVPDGAPVAPPARKTPPSTTRVIGGMEA